MSCNTFKLVSLEERAAGRMPHLRVPRDTTTIQQAIDLAPEGGVVAVDPGTFAEVQQAKAPHNSLARWTDRTVPV